MLRNLTYVAFSSSFEDTRTELSHDDVERGSVCCSTHANQREKKVLSFKNHRKIANRKVNTK